jgi:hypothetical protein
MPATALQSIEAELDRLERQRVGYALAHASSQDDRTRARHERTMVRLDEEIAALQEAAGTLVHASTPSSVPVVDRTAEFTAEQYDEQLVAPRPRWIWPAVGASIAAVVAAIAWWAARPATPPSTPAVAPASVIITRPVPPDSHR